MKKIAMAVFVAMVIASCAKEEKSENTELEQITLSATFATSPSAEIKPEHQTESRATATAFEANDELGLFVVKSGMEVQKDGNLVNNHKMVVGSDGVIKGTPTAVYYPTSSAQTTSPTSQVTIHSYYPYQSGDATADALGVLVGIRTDQTDFLDVKRSDLCFGSLDNVEPSKTAQPITFKHSFAQVRVNVALFAGCPAIKQLRLINVKDSATLNMQTGAISLKSHTAEVLAYKSAENSYSTIIPAQTLNGACIAIDLVDNKTTYIYSAISPISLTQSATNTLNLAINDKGVASLNGTPSVTAWTTATSSGVMNSAINNQISLYWLAPHSDYATADKITLSTTDPLGVTREIDLTPTLDPTSSPDYAVYNLDLKIDSVTYPLTINKVQIYKSTNLLSECPDVTLVGKVLYKLGAHVLAIDANRAGVRINNLIWAPGNLVANGENGCKVGAPTDYGLYFHFGSLVGWSGGAMGNGVGQGSPALEQKIKPAGYSGSTTWPAGYTTSGDVPATDNAETGVGDPCRYYLGGSWRLPTNTEFSALFSNVANGAVWASCPTGAWSDSPAGAWGGPGAKTANPASAVFFSAAGYRHNDNGLSISTGSDGDYWSSMQYDASNGGCMTFTNVINPRGINARIYGFTIRCVKDIPTEPQTPTANDYITINDLKWAKGNLVAAGGQNAKVGAPTDYGLYFHFGSLIGWAGGASGDGTGTGSPALAVKVRSTGYTGSTSWPAGHTTSGNVPPTDTPSTGVGDPCRYYLGGAWRLPTNTEFQAINDAGQGAWASNSGISGRWFGPSPGTNTSSMFVPASGLRSDSNGSLTNVTTSGYEWCSIQNGSGGYSLGFNSSVVYPQDYTTRSTGFPVRCVEGVSIGTDPGTWAGVDSKGATLDVVVIVGGASGWTASATGAGFTATPTSGKSGDKITLKWADNSAEGSPARNASVVFTATGSTSGAGKTYTFNTNQNAAGPPNSVNINGTWWATGNLIADGANGCKIGQPEDGGLYFQFGSVIGWKGGATGDGTGRPAKANDTFYNGSSFNANNEYAVYPKNYLSLISNIGTAWPSQSANLYYFGLSSYSTNGANLHDFAGFSAGTLASAGVGDPCRYYLGGTWRMPTYLEIKAMTDLATKTWTGSWTNATSTDSYFVCTFAADKVLKFPAVGYRHNSVGSIFSVGNYGYYWSSSVYNSNDGCNLNLYNGGVNPQSYNRRAYGIPVRCVSN